MDSTRKCSECGKIVPDGVPGGFCAHCLLGLGLHEAQSEASAGEPPGGGTPPAGDGGQNPEEPSESGPAGEPDVAVGNAPPLTEKAGDRIGRYRLLQEIGNGGCGVVYMAQQEEPVRRRVALKVIKLGMDIREQAHPDDWRTYKTHSLLGACLLGQKRHAEAEPWLRSGYEGLTRHEARIPAASRQRLTEAIQWLVDLYQAVGKSEQTAALKQRLAELEEAQSSRKALAHSPAESPP